MNGTCGIETASSAPLGRGAEGEAGIPGVR